MTEIYLSIWIVFLIVIDKGLINLYQHVSYNLYYVNPEQSRIEQSSQQNPDNEIAWGGFPQYNEFCFIRTDSNVSGYTVAAPNETPHILFDPKDASFYNWFVYLLASIKISFSKVWQ